MGTVLKLITTTRSELSLHLWHEQAVVRMMPQRLQSKNSVWEVSEHGLSVWGVLTTALFYKSLIWEILLLGSLVICFRYPDIFVKCSGFSFTISCLWQQSRLETFLFLLQYSLLQQLSSCSFWGAGVQIRALKLSYLKTAFLEKRWSQKLL